jgi:hypothetical protein
LEHLQTRLQEFPQYEGGALMSSPYGPAECAVGTFSAFPHGVIGGPEPKQKSVSWMAYTDAEVKEVRIVLTIYTDARLAGKKGMHPRAKEPVDFLPPAKRARAGAWAAGRGRKWRTWRGASAPVNSCLGLAGFPSSISLHLASTLGAAGVLVHASDDAHDMVPIANLAVHALVSPSVPATARVAPVLRRRRRARAGRRIRSPS